MSKERTDVNLILVWVVSQYRAKRDFGRQLFGIERFAVQSYGGK